MRILPVIDLLREKVVRGVAGKRSEYRPIVSPLVNDSRPETVAKAFQTRFGFRECYVADLDAISGQPPNVGAWRAISERGFALWLDAGTGDCQSATSIWRPLTELAPGANWHRLIVGLESLATFEEFQRIVIKVGAENIAFSLDLKSGLPLTANAELRTQPPLELAAAAIDAGVRRLIVLDLADVGTGGGTRTLDLCKDLSARHPQIELIAGGGVRHLDDLRQLAAAGCSAALVASSLHDGRLSPEDCRQL